MFDPRSSYGGTVTDTDWAFRAQDVTKVYKGGLRANDSLTLRIEPGEVYGLLGPNGAGKSTLVKQVIGLLAPTSGSLAIGPHDLVAHPEVARQLCSYLPQAQMPIDSFRAPPRPSSSSAGSAAASPPRC